MGYSLHLAHLYGDLLNTYGDIGNVLVLEYYAKQMGIEFTSEIVSIEQDFDEKKFDLAFFGGGQDFEQTIVSKDIQRMKESLTTFIEDDGPMLAICGGYQLLGQYYIGAHGERIEGIHALSHHTESQINHRFIGDITIKNEETGETYHGFENQKMKSRSESSFQEMATTEATRLKEPSTKTSAAHTSMDRFLQETVFWPSVCCSLR